jgi:hypothetical protein
MKGNLRYSFVFVVLVLVVILVFTAGAKASSSPKGGSADKGWSAIDKVPQFIKQIDDGGFTWEEGEFVNVDWVKDTCDGKIPNTFFNNPQPNAYGSPVFDSKGVELEAYFLWQLGADEAIVLIGQTPDPAAYFSYQTILGKLPDDPKTKDIDESDKILGLPIGDAINIETINTIGPNPFNRPIVYIITGNRSMEQQMRAKALAAGYPAAIINVEVIAPALAPLGYGEAGSFFLMAHRIAVPEDPNLLQEYLRNPPYRVFRITPPSPLQDDPEPVPVLRVRGTGHTEMDLYPALKELREAILKEHEGMKGMLPTELDTKVFELPLIGVIVEKPYVGLQRYTAMLGGTRDTNYLSTYRGFMLREGIDEYVIVYGVNHQMTGKVTYSSVSTYVDLIRWFGVGTMLSTDPDFAGSARHYLPNNPAADMLYAIKVARNCNGEDHCLEVRKDFVDIDGNPYPCVLEDLIPPIEEPHELDLDEEEMFFVFRSYMEPSTLVGPDDNELLYDRAIYFGPYFDEQLPSN